MWAVAVLWLTCLSVSAWSQEPAPRPGEHRHKQQTNPQSTKDTARREPRGTADAPLIVKVVPAPPDQEQLAREARERQEKAANEGRLVRWTISLAIGTWILAFVTFIVSVFTGINLLILKGQGRDLRQQRDVMQRQADHLEEQATQLRASVDEARNATRATERAADATAESVDLARANAEVELRAYISVEDSGIQDQGPVDPVTGVPSNYFSWGLWIVNTGLTPAYDVTVDVVLGIHPFPLPADFQRDLKPLPNPSRIVIGSRQRKMTGGGYPRTIPPAELAQIRNRAGRAMYIYGQVLYSDVFGQRRKTEFCEFAMWDASGKIVGGMTEQYNESD